MEPIFYENRTAIQDRFTCAKPFSSITFDKFFPDEQLDKVRAEILSIKENEWIAKLNKSVSEDDNKFFTKKKAFNAVDKMGVATRELFEFMNSQDMISFLEDITGIYGLQSDPQLYGGGIHKISEGGRLSIHADFNMHPRTQLYRRVNLILYLNKNWVPDYNGELEFWNENMTECERKVPPIFNKMVIFKNTDTSFHGHPNPWLAPFDRLSIALYYYTTEAPTRTRVPFHWTMWQKRYGIDY
jgi:Rps23 Pro-64 3,4-dihydroxylase Tpa1-like proline 4-hydroxylase